MVQAADVVLVHSLLLPKGTALPTVSMTTLVLSGLEAGPIM